MFRNGHKTVRYAGRPDKDLRGSASFRLLHRYAGYYRNDPYREPGKALALDPETAEKVILGFKGDYDQIPPMYSALKVDGKKLCDLARAGKEVERKARRVQILEISILNMELPRVSIRVTCSKGTYIRTLCDDIGRELGTGGCMEHLLRTRVDRF